MLVITILQVAYWQSRKLIWDWSYLVMATTANQFWGSVSFTCFLWNTAVISFWRLFGVLSYEVGVISWCVFCSVAKWQVLPWDWWIQFPFGQLMICTPAWCAAGSFERTALLLSGSIFPPWCIFVMLSPACMDMPFNGVSVSFTEGQFCRLGQHEVDRKLFLGLCFNFNLN